MATFDEIKAEYEDGMSPAIRIGELITMVEKLQARVEVVRGLIDEFLLTRPSEDVMLIWQENFRAAIKGEQEKHVCGLQGFDGMKGDTCPACIAIKGESDE